MAALLKERAEMVDPMKLSFIVNDRRAEILAERVKQQPLSVNQLSLRLTYASELVNSGRIDDCLKTLDAVREDGIMGEVGGLNMVSTDYNNDGRVDVWILRGGWMGSQGRFPLSLLRNDGKGKLSDVTVAAGLLRFAPTQTAAWFDYDGDGWLDLFVGNESATTTETRTLRLAGRSSRTGAIRDMVTSPRDCSAPPADDAPAGRNLDSVAAPE